MSEAEVLVVPPGQCYYNTIMLQRYLCVALKLQMFYFSPSSVVSRTFSVLSVYLKFGHHPHPVGYLCAKFRFFRGLHCSAKIGYSIDQSLNHTLTHPAYLMPQKLKHKCFRILWTGKARLQSDLCVQYRYSYNYQFKKLDITTVVHAFFRRKKWWHSFVTEKVDDAERYIQRRKRCVADAWRRWHIVWCRK